MGGLSPNVRGPSNACRKLYYYVWESVVLYVSPVWPDALAKAKNKKTLNKAQRCALISTSMAYRIVSHAALCVLTGTMPVHIKVQLRGKVYIVKKMAGRGIEDRAVVINRMKLFEEEA